MLKNRVSQEELQGFSELRRAGIPLDEAVVEEIETAARGLVIRPSGNVAENCVFDLDSGGAGYMLAAAIYNASKRIHWAHEARLELLWPESDFRWLENPLGKIPRSFDRTLSQLERLQRMRLGQPVLPELEVRHSL